MVKDVPQLKFKILNSLRKIILELLRQGRSKNVMENIGTHCLQQVVFRFKVSIKRTSSNVRSVNDFLNCDMFESFCFQ